MPKVRFGSPIWSRMAQFALVLVVLVVPVDTLAVNPTVSDGVVITDEDLSYSFKIPDFSYSDGDPHPLQKITISAGSGNGSLELNGGPVVLPQDVTAAELSGGKLIYKPLGDDHGIGVASFDFNATDTNFEVSVGVNTITINVRPVGDTPGATNATTDEDIQSTTGLKLSRNVADGAEVSHFKITNITNGTLYKNDGATQIGDGAFILFAEGDAGLKFTPTPLHSTANGSFDVQAATSGAGAGLSAGKATATITVDAVNDDPEISGAVGSQTMDDDATLAVFAAVTLSDVDAGDDLSGGVTVVLSDATNGTFTA
ncbi:MAG: hypothetical protein O2780_17705, partial [Proteobacteria bacterium]|nr:hypothetical protein [Pseudomonadota bacterium]